MEVNFLFFLTVVPAIILYGIAKSGLGGSMTLISVPLMIIYIFLIFSIFVNANKLKKSSS